VIDVLIADDHPLVRRSIGELLDDSAGLSVVARCEDGDQVLDAVLRHRPHVALLDLRMLRVSGLEAAREVRAASDTRVLLVTGSWTADLRASAEEAGVSGLVLKGEDPSLLPLAVRRVAAGGTFWGPARRGRADQFLPDSSTWDT